MTMYEELTARVAVPDRPDGTAEGKRFWTRRFSYGIVVGIILVIIILAITLLFRVDLSFFSIVLIGLFTLVVALVFRHYVDRNFAAMLNDDCDPEGFMAAMAEALRRSHGTALSIDFVSSYGSGALCAGHFDQAVVVGQYLHELSGRKLRYHNSDRALFEETILYVELSLAMMDEDALTANLVTLSQLSDAHPYWMAQQVRSRLEYSTLLKLYHDQNWDLLITSLKGYQFPVSCKRYEVKRNYYLYRVYRLKGDEASAAAARDFVLDNGGGLWYRTRLLSETSGPQELPAS